MNGWQVIPSTIPLLMTALLALILILYTLRGRQSDLSVTFILLTMLTGGWALLDFLQRSALTLGDKDLLTRFIVINGAFIGPLWLVFTLQYTDRSRWLRLRHLIMLFLPALLTALIVLTNDLHRWVYITRAIEVVNGVTVLRSVYGFWFWVHTFITYTAVLFGNVLLIIYSLRSPQRKPAHAIALAVASMLPGVSNLLFVNNAVPSLPDFTSYTFFVSLMIFSLAVLRFGMLEFRPNALETLFQELSTPVVALDAADRVVLLNPAARRWLGDMMLNKHPKAFFPSYSDVVEKALRQEDCVDEIEVVNDQTPNSPEWVEYTKKIVRDHSGRKVGSIFLLYNITQRKKRELALAQARDEALTESKVKTHVLGKTSHDLRTPLNAIGGFAELLMMGAFGELSVEQRGAVQEIQQSAQQLEQRIRQVVDHTRLRDGQLVLKETAFELIRLTDRLETARRTAENKGVALTVTIDPQLPPLIYGDFDRLSQIMLTLINNAIRYTRRDGYVAIDMYRQTADEWRIRVRDDGIGIPESEQALLFEPFRLLRYDSAGVPRIHGLKLSFVRDMTRFMGGELLLESVVGQGTTFTMTLPLRGADDPPATSLPGGSS